VQTIRVVFGLFTGAAFAEGVAATNWISVTAGFVAGEEIHPAGLGTDVAQVIGGEYGGFTSATDAAVLPGTGEGDDTTEDAGTPAAAAEGTGIRTAVAAEGTGVLTAVAAEGIDTMPEA